MIVKKYISMLDLSVVMRYFTPYSGIYLPDTANVLWKPKYMLPFYAFTVPLGIYLMIIFTGIQFGSLTYMFASDGSVSETFFHFILGCNAACGLIRYYTIVYHHSTLQNCVQQVNCNLKEIFQSKYRQEATQKYMKPVNMVIIGTLVMQSLDSLVVQIYNSFWQHVETHRNAIPGDRNNILVLGPMFIFGFISTTFGWLFTMSAFEWLLLTFLCMASLEMEALRYQLAGLFGSLRVDQSGHILIRKYLSQSIIEQLVKDEPSPDPSLWMTIDSDPFYTKNKILELDELSSKWITHYARNVKLCRNLKQVFGGPIAFTYMFTIILSTSWILSSKSSTDENYNFLPIYALVALVTLYVQSFYGEKLLTAANLVTRDAFEKDWFCFPIRMQKKLLLAIAMSQRPMYLDVWGQAPLCQKSYGSVINFCYSIFSFMSRS